MPGFLYLRLIDYKSGVLTTNGNFDPSAAIATKDVIDSKNNQFFNVTSYSCDVSQVLNIGSQSTGAGVGKVTFNPFSITRVADAASPMLFQNAAAGTPFKTAEIFITNGQNLIMARHTFKLVAVRSVAWSAADSESSFIEAISFEYGGLHITMNQQTPDGKIIVLQGGWNRVKNIRDGDVNSIIQ